jgi:uncharacterized Zn-finger protein
MAEAPKTTAHPEKARAAMFAAPELIVTDEHRVMCDGGGGALGHPRVWYDMGDEGFVDCGYCDRRFVARGGPFDPGAR